MNLASAFASAAEKSSPKTALFWGDQEFSYEVLWAQTRQLAIHLQQSFGVRRGDRVALWLKNCPEFVPALFSVLHAGGVVVPVNNFLKPDEVSFILADAGIDVVITDASMAEGVAKLSAARP